MIKVITGCMKSGKTQHLLQDIKTAQLMNKRVGIFYAQSCEKDSNTIKFRNQLTSSATPVSATEFLKDISIFSENYDCIFIDEAQFLAGQGLKRNHPDFIAHTHKMYDIQKAIQTLSDKKTDIYLYGIDTDFAANTFELMDRFLGIADEVIKEKAICDKCKQKNARRNLRLLNGIPDNKNADVLVMDGTDEYTYMTVCVDCYNEAYNEAYKNKESN